MNEGLYFFAGGIVTLAVVGFATWLRGPSEEQRRREAARAKRPTTPPPVGSLEHLMPESARRIPSGIRPSFPPPRVKHGGIGNPAYRKGKR